MKVKEIEELLKIIAQSGLEEVNIEIDQIKISARRTPPATSNTALQANEANLSTILPLSPQSNVSTASSITSIQPNNESRIAKQVTIRSPMIGTFYRSAEPESPAFVQEGDSITQGQTLCIIEAMKFLNEITAERAGTVIKVLIEDASPVEYDQPLFLVEPT